MTGPAENKIGDLYVPASVSLQSPEEDLQQACDLDLRVKYILLL